MILGTAWSGVWRGRTATVGVANLFLVVGRGTTTITDELSLTEVADVR